MYAAGEARLVSACLPYTSIARGMLMAVLCMSQLGIVHADLKPDNFMVGHDDTLFLIKFGSACHRGGAVPMSCQDYRPDDTFVSAGWVIYSFGKMLREVFLKS